MERKWVILNVHGLIQGKIFARNHGFYMTSSAMCCWPCKLSVSMASIVVKKYIKIYLLEMIGVENLESSKDSAETKRNFWGEKMVTLRIWEPPSQVATSSASGRCSFTFRAAVRPATPAPITRTLPAADQKGIGRSKELQKNAMNCPWKTQAVGFTIKKCQQMYGHQQPWSNRNHDLLKYDI